MRKRKINEQKIKSSNNNIKKNKSNEVKKRNKI
jgi:hypothetical protein